ncbi:MAG TPA: PIN domain-containing protein [Candidatus Limnocylindrales bacterium]|nr:PIN domain-containing protein [Candidatus Limnocylindrales bacterium]
MIVLDTSGLLAAIDAKQHQHDAAAAVLRQASGPLLLSPFVLAELDYLISTRVSTTAAQALLGQVSAGVYRLESMNADDVAAASEIIERYRDLELGLADASLVVLADRYDASDLLTLDERHFRAVRGPFGRPFRILPADA